MIICKNLIKSYPMKDKTVIALDDVSIEIKKGEFFGIVGRNGSGKSTLLKLLAGIYSPDSGHIQVNGKLTPFIELGVGFNFELTGKENVFLNGALLGFSRREMLEMYDEIVEFAELEKFMDQKLKNYSSGMQVRLAFSIAIRANSDILLLDEVLAVGDINFQKKCFKYFKSLKDKKKTVVFVSHDMSAIKEYCDNGILIDMSEMVPASNFGQVIDKYMKIMNPQQAVDGSKKPKSIKNQIEIIDKNITINVDQTKLRFKIKFHEYNKGVKFYSAFSVKNNIEQKVFGTSTELYDKPMTPTVEKNVFELEWILSSVLSRGAYSVNVSVTSSDKTNQATFEDIIRFDNDDAQENYYSINPVKELKIK